MDFEVIDRPTAIASQHAGRVRVVNHHDGAIFFRQIAQRGQRANVAIHGEDAVADQQLAPRLVLDAGEFRLGRVLPSTRDFAGFGAIVYSVRYRRHQASCHRYRPPA